MNPPKQAEIAILMSDKVNFKPKLVRRDKGGHSILRKGTIHQEERKIVPNIIAPKFIKQTLVYLQTQIDSSTTIVADFNTPIPQ
jgi:hypothetical protein